MRLALCEPTLDIPDGDLCELRLGIRFADEATGAAPLDAVVGVIRVRAQLQMRRIDARRVVAAVPDDEARVDGDAVVGYVGEGVRLESAASKADGSVALPVTVPLPFPALVRAAALGVSREPFGS